MTAVLSHAPRLLGGDTTGPVPWQGRRGGLIPVVAAAGLTGRGGASFPTARKLAAVAAGAGEAVVIANGAEAEPASAKDATLLQVAPNLVLDGLQLAVEAVGAGAAYLYLPQGLAARLGGVLAERATTRRDRTPVRIVVSPATFLAGEESAAVAAVEGRAALPWDAPQRVFTSGVRGAPTLVLNVETLAHLALIARHGPQWFRQLGTAEDPGTFLATVGGPVARPGVCEAAYGVRLHDLLALAGGAMTAVQAVLVGGYHGAWLPASALPEVTVDRAALRRYGASPGAGVISVLPAGACGLRAAAGITTYLAGQSAQQCGPCRNGLPALAGTLHRLAYGDRDADLAAQVHRLAALVTGRGTCRHPDGTARFITSTMQIFDDEVARHLRGACAAYSGW